MGGKGKRRREKNYKAAHGDHHTRLPPPPDPSQLDALPSKLRKLFSFSNPDHRKDETPGGGGQEKKRKRGGGGAEEGKLQKRPSKDDDDRVKFKGEDRDEARDDANNKKKNKKRKRGQVEDLRFEALEGGAKYGDKRRERKKKFLEAKKKKKQKKKEGANAEEESEFPGRERITFGEVVQAPPKLLSSPKAVKKKVLQSAYKERLRLEFIDAYRQQRGWTNRPGLKLPSLDLTPAL